MSQSYKIITLGCKVNQVESAYFSESLRESGWRAAAPGEAADISIINTCIVTRKASYQSRQAIRRAIRENPSGKVAAVGCYAQVFPDELAHIKGVHLIAGNRDKARLPDILLRGIKAEEPCVISKPFAKHSAFEPLPLRRFIDRTRAFLKIQDGCESFCSHCIVPFARGPLRSLAPESVMTALESLAEEGYREVVLTGIHLGKYGVDLSGGIRLTGLLRSVGKRRLPLRIRLSSLEPNEIGPELIDMTASEEWLCRHFHIPLQSGDDRILRKMNRDYTARKFTDLVGRLHHSIPRLAVGVDVMVGFPGEDEKAHVRTLSLIKDLPAAYLHVFPYSPRKGTAAASFPDQVESKVIKARAAEIRHLGQQKRMSFYGSCLGETYSVLAEGWQSECKKFIKGFSDPFSNSFPAILLNGNCSSIFP